MRTLILLSSFFSAPALGDTLTFVQGDGSPYSTTDDTILSSADGWSETNLSEEEWLFIDVEDGGLGYGQSSTLIRFPDAFGEAEGQVSADAELISAEISLYIANPGGLVEAFELLEDWDIDEVTWLQRSDDDEWEEDGANDHPSHATKVLDDFEGVEGEWVTLDLTPAAKFWAEDPSQNFGIILKTESNDGTDIPSSDYGDEILRPMLTVIFNPPDDDEPDNGGDTGGDDDGGGTDPDTGSLDTGDWIDDPDGGESTDAGNEQEFAPSGELVANSCSCTATRASVTLSWVGGLLVLSLARRRA